MKKIIKGFTIGFVNGVGSFLGYTVACEIYKRIKECIKD